jgi:hypothetical protein
VVTRALLGSGGRRRLPALVAAAVTVATVALPAVARACTVCYGAADDAMIDGTRLSVVFLLGLTYLLLGGGVGMFLLSRRHHRNAAERTIETHRGADAP